MKCVSFSFDPLLPLPASIEPPLHGSVALTA
jgi:hypothetical protein